MGYLLAAILLAVGAAALRAAATSRPDRNYWPMIRVIFMALAFVYIGSGVNRLLMTLRGDNPRPGGPLILSIIFSAAILAALLYGVVFMRKRNRLARFLGLTLGGDIVVRSVEELTAAAILTESWVYHGSAPEERVAALRAACDRWDTMQAWEAGLRERSKGRGIE